MCTEGKLSALELHRPPPPPPKPAKCWVLLSSQSLAETGFTSYTQKSKILSPSKAVNLPDPELPEVYFNRRSSGLRERLVLVIFCVLCFQSPTAGHLAAPFCGKSQAGPGTLLFSIKWHAAVESNILSQMRQFYKNYIHPGNFLPHPLKKILSHGFMWAGVFVCLGGGVLVLVLFWILWSFFIITICLVCLLRQGFFM